MTSFMREEFGSNWFKRREAGHLLTDLWALGQQPTADELLKDVPAPRSRWKPSRSTFARRSRLPPSER